MVRSKIKEVGCVCVIFLERLAGEDFSEVSLRHSLKIPLPHPSPDYYSVISLLSDPDLEGLGWGAGRSCRSKDLAFYSSGVNGPSLHPTQNL